MLVTIMISAALVSGTIFGWFCSTELKKRKDRREQRLTLKQKTTPSLKENVRLLTEELEKRKTNKESPYR